MPWCWVFFEFGLPRKYDITEYNTQIHIYAYIYIYIYIYIVFMVFMCHEGLCRFAYGPRLRLFL